MSQRPREKLFEQIVNASRRTIYAIARSYAGSDAADLYQEILLQVWKGLDGFDERRARLSTWVYRVALNTAITFRRKAIRLAAPTVSIVEDTIPSAQAGPRRELDILHEFVASLGKVDRAILLLYLDDLSYEDMADVTGLQKNHIGVRLNRIKKAFVERYIGR